MQDVTRTDLYMAGLLGAVESGDPTVVRTPHNPGFYHGNYLLFGGPPRPPGAISAFRTAFPEADHVCLRWDDAPLDDAGLAAWHARGFETDGGISMAMDTPPAAVDAFEVRPFAPAEWPRVAATNSAWDPTEHDGSEAYRTFKQRLFQTYGRWVAGGHATWWGAFDGDELVGQCGIVPVRRLGRFQSIETHPDHRRRGVATALVTAVARHAFGDGRRRLLLSAEPDGPAHGLYTRLGFRDVGLQHSLLYGAEALHVRPEAPADRAGVRSLLAGAFDTGVEADLVDGLREEPGVVSLVIERSGRVLGHVLFTPVRVEPPTGAAWTAIALGPMAVRPGMQRQGIGTALLLDALDRLRPDHPVCFVLGHPRFYPRGGFRPAPPLGLRCRWDVPDDVFMVAELQPGGLAGRTGRVEYHPAFGE